LPEVVVAEPEIRVVAEALEDIEILMHLKHLVLVLQVN
jgi:hypothetical protein